MRSLKYDALRRLIDSLLWLTAKMSLHFSRSIFSLLADLGFRLLKSERMRVIRNLKLIYPEWTPSQQIGFTRKVFKNVGLNAADFFYSINHFREMESSDLLQIHGRQNLQQAFEKGRGVLVISCHLGAFELIGSYCAMHFPTSAVGRKLKSKALDEMLVNNRRDRGIDYSHREKSGFRLLRALKEGHLVIMLMDQDSDKLKSTFCNFMGHPAATPVGPALLVQRSKCVVLPIVMHLENGRQILTIGHEIEMQDSGRKEDDLHVNTQEMTDALEQYIKKNPEQWMWMHERWKRQPAKE
ncbi:MAG: lysophospholipid acyltransferase family protein [Bacteroidota bacterium]